MGVDIIVVRPFRTLNLKRENFFDQLRECRERNDSGTLSASDLNCQSRA